MTSNRIITFFKRLSHSEGDQKPHFLNEGGRMPSFVRQSAVAMRYLQLLSPLDWEALPPRPPQPHNHQAALSYATFAAACLLKLEEQLVTMAALRRHLVEHPALLWLFDFPLAQSRDTPWGFEPEASLPTARHLTRLLRSMPNAVLQTLLDSTISLLQAELAQVGHSLGDVISLDTKHVVAWVKENNPKAYIKDKRYDKHKQPKGDPDCKLGCKRRRNQRASSKQPPPTPTNEAVPANTISVGEYYWGYASGVVATKIDGWGEFVLAELTQPFDRPDISYFFPLMSDTERRLGLKPRYGAFDAAFDAWYIYQYFHSDEHDGFAAIPFSERGGYKRAFDPQGLPLCLAGFPMPRKYTFHSKRSLVEHECGRHVCPLRFPKSNGQTCPIDHKQWPKGGCTSTMPTAVGARIRYQLDRHSDVYKQVYKQRTATERINSQAKALGIERPKLRNRQAITNLNTLIYILINLRALHRVRSQKSELFSTAILLPA